MHDRCVGSPYCAVHTGCAVDAAHCQRTPPAAQTHKMKNIPE